MDGAELSIRATVARNLVTLLSRTKQRLLHLEPMEKHVTAMFKKETELIGWLDVIKLKGLAAQDWIESTSAQLSPLYE